ncbi:hypothetical protein H4R21_005122, partial [Coemansia helicoidea]
MPDIDAEKLRAVCAQIVREGDLDSLTDRVVRRNAESAMGLASKALDEQPYKKIVKDAVVAALASITGDADDGGDVKDEGDAEEGASSSEAAALSGKEDAEDAEEASENEAAQQSSDDGDEDAFSEVDDEPAPAAARAQKRGGGEKAPAKTKRARTE